MSLRNVKWSWYKKCYFYKWRGFFLIAAVNKTASLLSHIPLVVAILIQVC